MKPARLIPVVALALAQWSLLPQAALAQVPPHNPGAVCSTPRLWCWANPPGRAGQPCRCNTPAGPVSGVYT